MRTRLIGPALLAAAALGVARPASAAQLCTADPTSPLPSPVFVTGSSTLNPVIAKVATALAGTTTIVYTSPSSCAGIDAIFNGTPMGTGTATYWDSTGTTHTCTLNNETADVGVSDVYYTSCVAPYVFNSLPTGVTESLGPVLPEAFVVPVTSIQSVINAQAAFMVYGFGGASGVTAPPWTDPTVIFQRGPVAGVQLILARAIGVPASKWAPASGIVSGGSNGMLQAVSQAGKTSPNTSIGILGSDFTDGTSLSGTTTVSNRTLVKILGYQHFGQQCAWLPDSTSTAYDKRNVRAGHYALWGQEHFFTAGKKAQAAAFVGYFTGVAAAPAGVNLLNAEIADHLVPLCAMRVQRSTEMGPESPYQPPQPCGCYMEEQLMPGTSGCASCSATTPCAAGICSFGFCEGG
jgi:hypothetical protein